MAYDPWAGYNQGMQNLGNTFTDLDRSRQAKEQHDLEAKRQALLSRALQLQVEDAERQQKMQEGLTQAVNQQPNAQFMPTPQEQPMPSLGGMPNTGQAPQQFQMPQSQQPASVFNTPGQIQQQQPNMERAMLDYYKKNDPVKAQEFSKELVARFKDLASVNPKGAVDWYNKVSGMNLTYEGQNGDYIITKTDDGKIIATDKKNPLKSEIVYEGAAKSSKDFATIDVGDRTIIRYFDGRPDEVMKKGVSPNTVFRIENRASGDDSNPVAQSTFVDPETGKPLVFDKKTGSYRIANVTGGVAPKPSALTPETAAKAQMIEQAIGYMPEINKLILGDINNPKVNRKAVVTSEFRIPFTEGRQASTLILDAVEAKLRAESGAAVPDPEVKRIAKRYIPQTGDKDDTIILKMKNLETFLRGTQRKMNTGRSGAARSSQPVRVKSQSVNNLRSKYGIGK